MGRVAAYALLAAVLFGPQLAAAQGGTRYAVIKSDATLLTSLKKKAQSLRAGFTQANGAGFDVEVLSTKGDHYKVRTVNSKHCYNWFSEISAYELTFWVAKSDVHQVLTEQISLDLGEGQRVEAMPGTVVADGKLWTDEVRLALDVPEEALGSTYERSADLGTPPAINARLGRGTWTLSDITIDVNKPVAVHSNKEQGNIVASLATGCIRFDLRVADDKTTNHYARGYGGMGGSGSSRLAKGTALSWSAGGRAGKARHDVALPYGSVKRGKSTCFKVTVGGSLAELCAPTKKIKSYDYNGGWGVIGGVQGGVIGGVLGGTVGHVSLSTVKVKGTGLTQYVVRRYLRYRQSVIRGCQNADGRMYTGKARVRFKVDSTGKPSSPYVKLDRTRRTRKTRACVRDALKAVRFPSPKAGKSVTVNATFLFQ